MSWRIALIVAIIIIGTVVTLRACRHSVAGVGGGPDAAGVIATVQARGAVYEG
jgi:hypothetical protein